MSNILKSIRLDNYILKAYYSSFLLVYGAAILIAIVTKIPALTVSVVTAISAPFIGVYFSTYEKNNLSKLYGILPLEKNAVITGRYLYALAFGVANAIVSTILAYVISLLLHIDMTQVEILTYTFAAFVLFCLFIAIQFPIYFKVPFSKVYIYSNLPFYLGMVAFIYLFRIRRNDLLPKLQQGIRYFTGNPNSIWVAGLGVGLLMLIISSSIARLIYTNREL